MSRRDNKITSAEFAFFLTYCWYADFRLSPLPPHYDEEVPSLFPRQQQQPLGTGREGGAVEKIGQNYGAYGYLVGNRHTRRRNRETVEEDRKIERFVYRHVKICGIASREARPLEVGEKIRRFDAGGGREE